MSNIKNKVLFWQARIKITQAPVPFEPREIPESLKVLYQEPEIRSFLNDPLGLSVTYGLELNVNDKIDITFFTKAESEDKALELGLAWLLNLKHEFLGLDGIVEAKPITYKDISKLYKNQLAEIILPEGIIPTKINILERFINNFYFNKEHQVKLLILWQRVALEKNRMDPQQPRHFLRVFINYDLETYDNKKFTEFKGILRFLSMNIENTDWERAKIEFLDDTSILDILVLDSVFKNIHFKSYDRLNVNFDLPETLPLPKLPILDKENVRYIDIDFKFRETAISIGKHVKNGVISNHRTYIPINKLPQDMVVFGKSGSGKTYFLARFIEEVSRKAKDVGILILNVAKESQEIYYKDFVKIKYSDENFHIPYFINGQHMEKLLQETATYICASLGLKNVYEKVIYRTEIGFLELKGVLPTFLIELLKGVHNYMINNPYGDETQANLVQALKNRINVFDEKKIQDVLKLSDDLPKWVKDWMNGKKIFLDLSMCNKYSKMIIVNAIFQLLRTITKDIEAEELKHLIVIDEAHALLEKPITRNSDDADFIMKEQMAKIFSELLKEYRSRGVGFIFADQSPVRLFDDVASQPSIKIIFRVDYPNNLIFTENIKERQMLTQLENRLAFVINGATGERYLIKSLDHELSKK